jgi:hypothetical protein
MTFPNVKTLWAAGKMFRYQRRDFLSLIMKFSDGKLKQKGFFHSVQYSSLQCGREEAGNLGQFKWVKDSISIPLF